MTDLPTIAVLIACHNRRQKTLACLDALAKQQIVARLQPIVFDDASSDGTSEAIRNRHPATIILPGDGAAFWAGGMRAAFDHALARDFDHYLWLNDDVVLEPDALARLLRAERQLTAEGADHVLVGGAVRDPRSGRFTYGGIVRRSPLLAPLRFRAVEPAADRLRICDTLHGNIVLIPARTARLLGSIGGAFVHTLGDLDYGLRVTRRGGTVALAAGYLGACDANPRAQAWFDPGTPLRTKWRGLRNPLVFPPRPWLHFARLHGGPFWVIYALLPFWRLFVPPALAQMLAGMRSHAPAA